MAKFKYELEYSPGKTNQVSDALSQKVCLVLLVSIPEGDLFDRTKEGLNHDPQAQKFMELAKEGKTTRFWVDDRALYAKGNRLFVPAWGTLRREILRECHDTPYAGHSRTHRTLAMVQEHFYLPRVREDVELYVRTCLVCQQDKVEQHHPHGLLSPLTIPERIWDSVSMDFIVSLLLSEGCTNILVIVD